MTHAKPIFEPLSRLFCGDHVKICRAPAVFRDAACSDDIEHPNRACDVDDRKAFARLRHEMGSEA